MLQVLSFPDITEVRPSKNQKHTVEVLYSSIGYSIGLNCDSEAEKLLKDLQHLLSSHRKLYHTMRRSHCSSVGKLLQVDGMHEHILVLQYVLFMYPLLNSHWCTYITILVY